jgi:hypothetical protein
MPDDTEVPSDGWREFWSWLGPKVSFIVGTLSFAWWIFRFLFARFVAPFLAYVIAGLAFLELVQPGGESAQSIHYYLHRRWPAISQLWIDRLLHSLRGSAEKTVPFIASEAFPLCLAVSSFIVAVLMVWHHRKLETRIHADTGTLKALQRILEDGSGLVRRAAELRIQNQPLTLEDPLTKGFVKDTLARLLAIHQDISVAVVLETSAKDDLSDFQIYQQLSRDLQSNHYDFAGRGLPRQSAAGKAVTTSTIRQGVHHGLVYIPNAKYPHGIMLWADKKTEPKKFLQWALLGEAFVQLSSERGIPPRAIACLEVKLTGASENRYVLCMDSDRVNPFREQHFQALLAAANAIGVVLSDIEPR